MVMSVQLAALCLGWEGVLRHGAGGVFGSRRAPDRKGCVIAGVHAFHIAGPKREARRPGRLRARAPACVCDRVHAKYCVCLGGRLRSWRQRLLDLVTHSSN